MPDSDERAAWLDDAVHEINMRWGEPLDGSDEPDIDPLPQAMVRETAEAILAPALARVAALEAALGPIAEIANRIDAIPYGGPPSPLLAVRDEVQAARDVLRGGGTA